MGTENGRAKNFPPPATGILVNFERRWLGMMTKMKKINVLIYQVTRFARDKYILKNPKIYKTFEENELSNLSSHSLRSRQQLIIQIN